jgi:hypothetical protein
VTSSAEAAREACQQVGLSPAGIRVVHEHATAVITHDAAGIAIRVSGPGFGREAARRAVAVAGWLAAQGFPATAPVPGLAPVEASGRIVTFWRYYPQPEGESPPVAALGSLLRDLHSMSPPPVNLPPYRPLEDLGAALAQGNTIAEDDRAWLLRRRSELISAYQQLNTALGIGMIHGDAYPGNLLWDGNRVLLGDWDEAATGPRELDLANTYQGQRFGRSEMELRAFADAYGHDLREWPGFGLLVEMRDLHTLGSFIRRAGTGSDSARTELAYRIKTLKTLDTDARWHAAQLCGRPQLMHVPS